MNCIHKNKKKLIVYKNTQLFKCSNCQLIFSHKIYKKINPQKIYKNYYKNELIGRFKYGLEYIIKIFRFFRAFKIYTLAPKAKYILDIGCGRGFTLYFLKKYYKFKKTIGTQVNQKAVNYCQNTLGLSVFNKDLMKLSVKKHSFDVVSCWHVLEHIRKPEIYISKVNQLLKKRGKFIIEVPNYNSWTRKITGKYWLGLDLEYHLNFFTKESLTRLLLKNNFIIKTYHTFSLEYSTFISVQSLVSWLTKTDQLFFNWLQDSKTKFNLLKHLLLFILLTPPCFLINMLCKSNFKGEILLVIAERK